MNLALFLPVVTLVLAVFFAAHYGIAVFLTRFFPLFAAHRFGTIAALFLLGSSFFLSSIIAHFADTVFTRAFYFFSGVWMGTFLNILLAILGTGAVLLISRFSGMNWSGERIASACLVLALSVSVYGVWNAFHPRIKHIEASIPNLPEAWRGQKLAHISDVHLGHVYREDFLQKTVAMINAEHPKMVAITGDLFDGMDGGLIDLVKPLDSLTAEEGVIFVGGNHETYLGTQKTFDILRQTKVRILRDEATDIKGLLFVGIAYPERGEKKGIAREVRSILASLGNRPSVLLYHAPAEIADVAKTGVNLQLSGHTHRGQQFPFQYVTHLVHKGFDYGKYVLGNYTLYTTSGVGTWGPPMRVGTQSEIVVITLKSPE